MRTTHIFLAVAVVISLAGPSSSETNAVTVIRSLMQPKRHIHESTSRTPISWSFQTNGTFGACALTGLESWSASGTWKERADGTVLLQGLQSNARRPDEKPTTFRRVLVDVILLETLDDIDICRFTFEGKQLGTSEQNSANNKSEGIRQFADGAPKPSM